MTAFKVIIRYTSVSKGPKHRSVGMLRARKRKDAGS